METIKQVNAIQKRLETRLHKFINTHGALEIENNFSALRLYRTIQRVRNYKYRLLNE